MKLQQISVSLSIGCVIYFFTLALDCITVADFSCAPGWKSYPYLATCIKAFTSSKNWYEAKNVCQEEGGDLVKFRDKKKVKFLADNVLSVHGTYWIGKKFYLKGYMNDCVEYTYFGYFVPNINLCTKPFYFICEVPSVCENNTYGANCSNRCSPHCGGANNSCDITNGSCANGCVGGYHGELCESVCENNTYGANCSNRCSPHCGGANNSCDITNGSCANGCVGGYRGEFCESVCEDNTYGVSCSKRCSPHCSGVNNTCDKTNGTCVFGCVHGYGGALCDIEIESVESASASIGTMSYSKAALVAFIILFTFVYSTCVCLVPMRRALHHAGRSTPLDIVTESEELSLYYSSLGYSDILTY
ncbi:hypothetical protein RRG08_033984 [Elysia crispata]|uniref:C-type lectin domain-containing protein n=1 Tax=Elysia crispata TaxID=231223 RepID=A0AAE0XR96_9GAST|nr:hypothetical protein RRG08_033984 [Elysia crispata]